METKEIIVVTNYMTNGGAQRVLSELVNEWSKKSHKVTIIQTMIDLSQSKSYCLNKDIKTINLQTKTFYIYDFIYKLIKIYNIIKSSNNATVINFTNPTLLLVGICSLFLKNKFVFSERNYPKIVPHSSFKRLVRNIVFRFADYCVFQTKDAKDYFPKMIQQKSQIIPNPINPLLPSSFIGDRRKTIVAVGRLNKQKNFPMLIKAFAMFIKEFPDYDLEIYGKGEDENLLKDLINKYSLNNKIHLLGFCDNIFNKIKDCSMYISSSNYEGISNSMLEAMGLGLPVISTDCPAGGAKMVIENGVNGLLIPVGDEEALYLAMKRIVEEKGLADKLSKEAEKIRKKYPAEKIAYQWLEIL